MLQTASERSSSKRHRVGRKISGFYRLSGEEFEAQKILEPEMIRWSSTVKFYKRRTLSLNVKNGTIDQEE